MHSQSIPLHAVYMCMTCAWRTTWQKCLVNIVSGSPVRSATTAHYEYSLQIHALCCRTWLLTNCAQGAGVDSN
jgi:hypothetical protein